MTALALVLATSGRAKPNLVHTCSSADEQFIEAARTNMTAMQLWSEQYQSGDASNADVADQAETAAKIMRGTDPTDWSLRQTQRLVIAMLSEYAKAIKAEGKHRNAGPHMYGGADPLGAAALEARLRRVAVALNATLSAWASPPPRSAAASRGRSVNAA